MRDYTKILAWQKADDLTVAVYGVSRGFPKEELYGLTSQLRRAVSSAPANIVEGASRDSKRDYLHFLYIARASLAEARYFIHLAGRLGYISEDVRLGLTAQSDETARTIAGLIRAVEDEAGKVPRALARLTSLAVVSLGCFLTRGV